MKRIGLYLYIIAIFLAACGSPPPTLRLHKPGGAVQIVNNGYEKLGHFADGLLSIQCSASASQDVGTYPMWQNLYATDTNKILLYGNPSTEKFEIVIRDLQDKQIMRTDYPLGSTSEATKARDLISDAILQQFEVDIRELLRQWEPLKAHYYCAIS